ncbi:MAG: hypothetical protein ACRERV_10455 [Methylococcales bacterium]
MTAEIESPVLEHLLSIRADIAELKREAAGPTCKLRRLASSLGR